MRVVDFFSGCGGTSQGFQDAGLEILAGIDNDRDAADSYRKNFPKANFIERDITALDVGCLQDIIKDRKEPLLFAGCAPCQPFSSQKKNKECSDDPRRTLLNEFARFVAHWQPEFICVENVPGIQRLKQFSPLEKFCSLLTVLGYSYEVEVVSASWFGVPQSRKRLILRASKNVNSINVLNKNFIGKEATVRDCIANLPSLKAGEVDKKDPVHQAAKLNPLNLERISSIKEGQGRRDWPEHLRLECHRNYNGHGDVYGRMSWDKLAPTLTTKCVSYSNGRFGHPEQNRAISAREAACLQTFPRNYKFSGSLVSMARQIGNAVPPLMATKIAESFIY
ncbi:DNA cytosine methyltransferase [Acetobacteraceae bacterium]|nr:DNA cytosine methyltransferase [Acetobacteraceae bacterium]